MFFSDHSTSSVFQSTLDKVPQGERHQSHSSRIFSFTSAEQWPEGPADGSSTNRTTDAKLRGVHTIQTERSAITPVKHRYQNSFISDAFFGRGNS